MLLIKLRSIFTCLLILSLAGCSMQPGYYGKKSVLIQEEIEQEEIAVQEPASKAEVATKPLSQEADSEVMRGLDQLPVGEQLTFSIRWLGLEAGRTTVTIKDIVKINGRDAYHIEAFSRTTHILDLLFRIRDYHDTFVDVEDMYSHRFVKKASEGEHSYDEINEFDYTQNKAFYLNQKSNERKVTDIPGKVQDIVSVSYWFRTQDVKVGDEVKTVLYSDEKNYDVSIKVLEKEEFDDAQKGKIPMMVIEPKAKRGQKVFKKGRAKIWVTNDDERIPLFAELHVIIAGALNIVLVSKGNIHDPGYQVQAP